MAWLFILVMVLDAMLALVSLSTARSHRAVLKQSQSITSEIIDLQQQQRIFDSEWAYLTSPPRVAALAKNLLPHLEERYPLPVFSPNRFIQEVIPRSYNSNQSPDTDTDTLANSKSITELLDAQGVASHRADRANRAKQQPNNQSQKP